MEKSQREEIWWSALKSLKKCRILSCEKSWESFHGKWSLMMPFFHYILLSTEKPAWGTGFFSPWCLATEKGWGWQNEDAAGSWGEQKEGKDRRLAEDAGESGSRALPWESRAQSAAECTLAAASNGKGSSGENSMSFPFLWVFQFISTLAGAGVPVQWQSAVVVAEICGMGPNISAFHKNHSNFIGAQ